MDPRRALVAALVVAAAALGCTGPEQAAPTPDASTSAPSPTTSPSRSPTATRTPEPTPVGTGPESTDGTLSEAAYGRGSTPPPWLSTRVLPETASGFGEVRPTPPALRRRAFTLPDRVPSLPGRGYSSRIVSPAPRSVIERSTWAPGCPVAADDLAWLRLTFLGFDARRHTGELLVHASAVGDLDRVFRALWQARFPMEQVGIVRTYDPDAPKTGDGNGTGGFVCRPTTGGTSFSQHAYGLALDVNTFQNPYRKGEVVLPELASAYLDREWVRPGMVTADGPVVAAFRDIGWEWGGAWSTLVDYQHFSANGR